MKKAREKLGFAKSYEAIIAEALDASEQWVGTHVQRVIDEQKNDLIKGVEEGEAEMVTYELFPQLKETLETNQYEG